MSIEDAIVGAVARDLTQDPPQASNPLTIEFSENDIPSPSFGFRFVSFFSSAKRNQEREAARVKGIFEGEFKKLGLTMTQVTPVTQTGGARKFQFNYNKVPAGPQGKLLEAIDVIQNAKQKALQERQDATNEVKAAITKAAKEKNGQVQGGLTPFISNRFSKELIRTVLSEIFPTKSAEKFTVSDARGNGNEWDLTVSITQAGCEEYLKNNPLPVQTAAEINSMKTRIETRNEASLLLRVLNPSLNNGVDNADDPIKNEFIMHLANAYADPSQIAALNQYVDKNSFHGGMMMRGIVQKLCEEAKAKDPSVLTKLAGVLEAHASLKFFIEAASPPVAQKPAGPGKWFGNNK